MGDSTGPLDIGRVIQQLFAVLGRNFATFLVLALVLVGLPSLLVGLIQMNFLHPGGAFNWQSAAGGIISGLGALILQATLIYGAVTDLNGRHTTVADCLSIGLRSFLPLIAIGIMYYIAIFVGSILLIVPGLMIAVAWCLCIPVYVVEHPDLMEAFRRSAQLTRGNRWRVFAIFVLYFVALLIIELVFGVFNSAMRIAAGDAPSVVVALVINPLLYVANALIGSTGIAVLYVELRRLRDGVGPEGLAAIFD
jgi:hypothetical protein